MKHSRILTSTFLAVSVAVMAFTGCSPTQTVTSETSDREIVQLAQTAYDKGNEKLAISYYEQLIMYYGQDLSIYVEGKYEIGHIYLKQKKYTQAAECFMDVISIYDSLPVGTLPGTFKKLSQNDLAKIPANKLTKNN